MNGARGVEDSVENNGNEKIQALLEEIAEDNTNVASALNRIAEAQAALRADTVRELDALRDGFRGALVYRALKDICRELAAPLAAIEAMLAVGDFSEPDLVRGHVHSLAITLNSILARMGAEKIPISPGEDLFNPERHLCARVVAPDESPFPGAPPRSVVAVLEDGYTLAGRVLAPARVLVQGERAAAALGENGGTAA